ncbi:MAG: prepilin-type N-terminal cleavage/methylation domain-containing protein [Candidatus Zixiibacteriota bacterium]
MNTTFRVRSVQGITLIELMTTVVIIGLVAGMAAPKFERAYKRIQFRSTTRDITSTMKLARSMAVASKDQYGIFFDPAQRTVTLFRDQVNLSNFAFESGDSTIRVDTLPTEFVYMSTDVGNNVIAFRANGSAGFTGGGNIYTMALSDDIVGIQTLNVLASTGRVHSDQWYY